MNLKCELLSHARSLKGGHLVRLRGASVGYEAAESFMLIRELEIEMQYVIAYNRPWCEKLSERLEKKMGKSFIPIDTKNDLNQNYLNK